MDIYDDMYINMSFYIYIIRIKPSLRKIADEVGVGLQGMLGQGFMDQYDLELDAKEGQVKAWPRASLPSQQPGDWRQLY